jgi:hypothetical protein
MKTAGKTIAAKEPIGGMPTALAPTDVRATGAANSAATEFFRSDPPAG